jgi:hypothetical protein
MEISVLATKCRYCGEEVGRPRDETRSLSVSDLGGETVQHYAPSSSVMEALEAFRSEEDSEPPIEEDDPAASGILSRFSKKQEAPKQKQSDSGGLPDLDERSQALASLAMPSARSKFQPTVVRNQRSIPRTVAVFAGLVAAMVCIYFGAVTIFANRPPEDLGPKIENHGAIMLERGDDPLEALKTSLETEALDPHPSHKEVSRQARRLLLQRVDGFLNTNPWKSADLDKASTEIGRIMQVDENPEVKLKNDEIRAERRAYQMFLNETDPNADQATFSYREAGGEMKEETKGVGERVLNRFEIVEIEPDSVSVVDHQRDKRPLTWYTNGEISSP